MILVGTQLNVSDNSGAKIIECIKILGKKSSSFASIGDIIVVSVKETTGKSKQTRKVEKGGIYKALVIETKKGIKRKDGSILRFHRNSALLLSEQGNPIGTRILGNGTYELRKKNQTKVLSLALRVF
uniref:Ribosomal protein L14 n=1 Tax=Monomastix sp. (strain OKE-1) TaxID=141716 RepID=U5YGF9_MONSK|nr:ribosomal protein L14 [Monomastix sp. OKE-1]AGZ90205.1 ribosomal protein L14 [Monomastix sp. OKE-1]